jgi:hypothetical protein
MDIPGTVDQIPTSFPSFFELTRVIVNTLHLSMLLDLVSGLLCSRQAPLIWETGVAVLIYRWCKRRI